MRFHRHLDRSSRLPCAALVGNFTFYGITLNIVGASVPQVIRAFGSTLFLFPALIAGSSRLVLVFPFILAFLAYSIGLREAFYFCLFLNGVRFAPSVVKRGAGTRSADRRNAGGRSSAGWNTT